MLGLLSAEGETQANDEGGPSIYLCACERRDLQLTSGCRPLLFCIYISRVRLLLIPHTYGNTTQPG